MRQQNRINNPVSIDRIYIESELKNGKLVIVQFANENFYNGEMLALLNELCAKYDENFCVRFYGHYNTAFDFETLLEIPNVKSLHVDCLYKAENVFLLSQLKNLKQLSLGVFELKETEILSANNLRQLNYLVLMETRTKALNLEHLKDFRDLQFFIDCGHSKNIDAIGELPNVEYLSLNSIKKTPIKFVNKLRKLKILKFILGGRTDIKEIEENNIEELEITWVRGFNDIGNICDFRKLKSLQISDNIRLSKVEFSKEIQTLEKVRIVNCKTLSSLTGLDNLTNLNELILARTNLNFDTLLNQKLPESLRKFIFGSGRRKEDVLIKERILARGYTNR